MKIEEHPSEDIGTAISFKEENYLERIKYLLSRIKELEDAWFVDEQIQKDGSLRPSIYDTVKRAEKLEQRVHELEEGIRKWHMSPRRSISDFDRADKELYKLLEGK